MEEIGDLPLSLQPKLLRVLQEGTVRRVGADSERDIKVRTVAATNRDLEENVRDGRFREDLFWRLNVIHLRVRLRERRFDIPLLVEYFIAKAAAASGMPTLDVSPEALAMLTAYDWPGNVRELGNALERAVAMADGAVLQPSDLPERIRSGGATAALIARGRERRLSLRELEREYILEIVHQTAGNKLRAAEILRVDRKTLYRKLDEYRAEDPTLNI